MQNRPAIGNSWQNDDLEIDVRALLKVLIRSQRWMLPLVGLFGIAAFVVLSSKDPVYTADSTVIIELPERLSDAVIESGGADASHRISAEAVNSKVQIIRSRGLATQVADELSLWDLEEYAADPTSNSVFPGEPLTDEQIRDAFLRKFDEGLTVYPISESRVIVIEYESTDKILAAAIANRMAETFISNERQARAEETERGREWIEREIAVLRKRVQDAEEAAETFRSRANLFFEGEGSANLPEQRLNDLSQSLHEARIAEKQAISARDSLDAALKAASGRTGRILAIPSVATDGLMTELRRNRAVLEAQIADLSATLLPRHPRMSALMEQRADLERQIDSAARAVLTALGQEAERAARQVKQLEQLVEVQTEETSTALQSGVTLRALEREARAERELLESLLSEYRGLLAKEGAQSLPVDARLVAQALVPSEPSGLSVIFLTSIFTTAFALLCFGLVIFRAFVSGAAFRRTAITADQFRAIMLAAE